MAGKLFFDEMAPKQLGTWVRYINSGLEEGEVIKNCLRHVEVNLIESYNVPLFGSRSKVQTKKGGRLQVVKSVTVPAKCSAISDSDWQVFPNQTRPLIPHYLRKLWALQVERTFNLTLLSTWITTMPSISTLGAA
jgi:hypothetical protein